MCEQSRCQGCGAWAPDDPRFKTKLAAWNSRPIEEALEARVAELRKSYRENDAQHRALIARAYRAAMKPDWQEGECLNEVLEDLRWAGIDEPRLQTELQQEQDELARTAALEEK